MAARALLLLLPLATMVVSAPPPTEKASHVITCPSLKYSFEGLQSCLQMALVNHIDTKLLLDSGRVQESFDFFQFSMWNFDACLDHYGPYCQAQIVKEHAKLLEDRDDTSPPILSKPAAPVPASDFGNYQFCAVNSEDGKPIDPSSMIAGFDFEQISESTPAKNRTCCKLSAPSSMHMNIRCGLNENLWKDIQLPSSKADLENYGAHLLNCPAPSGTNSISECVIDIDIVALMKKGTGLQMDNLQARRGDEQQDTEKYGWLPGGQGYNPKVAGTFGTVRARATGYSSTTMTSFWPYGDALITSFAPAATSASVTG